MSRRTTRNPPETEQVIALTLLTAAETAHAFSAFLPSFFTIRTFALQGGLDEVCLKLENLRSGYIPAVTFGLALGGVVSALAKSPLPLVGSALTAVFMVSQYERALPERLRAPALSALGGGARCR